MQQNSSYFKLIRKDNIFLVKGLKGIFLIKNKVTLKLINGWCWSKNCFQNQNSHEPTSPVKVVDISTNSYVNISQLYSETHQKYDRNQNSASYPDQNLKERGYKLNLLETSRKMLNSSKPQTLVENQILESKFFLFHDLTFSFFHIDTLG